MIKKRQALLIVLSFIAGVGATISIPRLVRGGVNRLIFPEHRQEVGRLTSPDGTVDAVAQRIDCGAPCSSEYAVSVVPKGAIASTDPVQQVFLADDAVNAQVGWKESHLLDISFDKAFIHNFHNVTYPMGRSGDVESWRYAVEIHLSPSARFSYLPDKNQAGTSR